MPRADLLALSPDDLATLTNKGQVNRARRELDEGERTCELVESAAGDVTVRWSDGVECRLPAGAALQGGRCSCAAAGVCLHLVRSVLAYQRHAAGGTPAATASWDPGAISDDVLARHFRPQQLSHLRGRFEQGLLVELVRGARPSARFHLESCLVRFLVPGDPRYTRCDCAASPCPHAVLAVWAFRQLPPAQKAAILSTGRRPAPAPTELLDRVEAALADFCEHGVSGAGSGYPGRLGRVEQACLAEDLVWPAEMLGELAREQERYEDHDSLFAPDNVRELVGELLVRADALRHDTTALPPLLIRGTSADRATVLGKSAFVGLGCGVRLRRGRTELAAYFQDSRSGSMAAIVREFADTEDDPARPLPPFAEMAGAVALRGIASATFAALGGSKLLINGGTRSARGHLSVRQGRGTADASVGDQDFAWEQLRAPVLAEDFAELADRLGALPPSSLRPRRVAEDFHVCAVAAVEGAGFDSATQTVGAVLCDGAGGKAGLAFPFTSRGRPGAEALLARLGSGGASLRFVAGPVRRVPGGLVFEPVALVFEEKGKRVLLQPWVESSAGGRGAGAAGARTAAPADPVAECRGQVQAALEDLLVLGLRRADGEAGRWHDLGLRAESTGLARLAVPLRRLADELEKKAHTLRWDPRPAVRLVLQLTAVLRLAQDLPDG